MADVEKIGMLEENPGQLSTMRVLVLVTVAVVVAIFLMDNVAAIISCLAHGKDIAMVDFSTNAVFIIASAFGFKAVQKFGEK